MSYDKLLVFEVFQNNVRGVTYKKKVNHFGKVALLADQVKEGYFKVYG